MVTILSSAKGSLVLQPDDNEWCQVLLDTDDRMVPLGADMRSTVAERLLRALHDAPGGPTSGMIDGVTVRWVLSLAERHSTVFVGEQSGRRILFVQADDGSLMATLPLNADDIARWSDQLREVGT
jgi:hypothetical protein